MTPQRRRLLLADRDGTLVRHVSPYIVRRDQVRYEDPSWSALRDATARGFSIVVVTNQSQLARGLISAAEVCDINRLLQDDARAAGVDLVTCLVCPHSPSLGCGCRKPADGLLREAALLTGLPLGDAVLVGDSGSDLAAAEHCGVLERLHVCAGRDPSACGRSGSRCIEHISALPKYLESASTSQGRG